jgi:hypothetical protein
MKKNLPVSVLYFFYCSLSQADGVGGGVVIRISVKYWEFLLLRLFESNRVTEYVLFSFL